MKPNASSDGETFLREVKSPQKQFSENIARALYDD